MADIRRQVGARFPHRGHRQNPGPGPWLPRPPGRITWGWGLLPLPPNPTPRGSPGEAVADICHAASPVVAIGESTLSECPAAPGVGMAGAGGDLCPLRPPGHHYTAARDLLALSRHLTEGGRHGLPSLIAGSDLQRRRRHPGRPETMTLNGVMP